MLIPAVEASLEQMLRHSLPLTTEQGEISFETPGSTWSAAVSRLTVNLFLYGVGRSPQPPRSAPDRVGTDGIRQFRHPLPMVELNYLVSAWAGSIRDEHELLGDVLTRLLAHQIMPPQYVTSGLASNIQLALADDAHNRPREVWAAIGGTAKASFTVVVTVAADAFEWQEQAPETSEVVPTLGRLGQVPT